MNIRFKSALILSIASCLGACATIPDAKVKYYAPKAILKVSLIQTAGCAIQKDAAGKTVASTPHLASEVKATVTYVRDSSRPFEVDLKDIDGWFSDTTISADLYEDGRLKGITTQQVGQGPAIVKGIASILPGNTVSGSSAACIVLDRFEKDLFQLTRTVEYDLGAKDAKGALVPLPTTTPAPIPQNSLDPATFRDLKNIFGDATISFEETGIEIGTVVASGSRSGGSSITLISPQELKFEVKIKPSLLKEQTVVQTVLDPSRGSEYSVPIPSAPFFGTNDMTLELAESGVVTKVSYGKKTGVTDAFSALSTGIDAVDGRTRSEKLADLKLENDIKAEQRRSILCTTTPLECK